MRIGVSGHQKREGVDWAWTAQEVSATLHANAPVDRAFTSLAAGSDQVFARAALSMGIPITAVIPCSNYARFFEGEERNSYADLLRHCERIQLPNQGSDEIAFLVAGQYVADHSDIMIAIWDGRPAVSVGGTADIVRYCVERSRPVLHLNPITRTTRQLGPTLKQT